ncbi:hypothetical protein ACQ4LE_003956 [Meloidogyne hapla]|uniref:Low-density lipoprotein receptor domain class A n=1 Tax=Meloidogyne hapla TaxID=6305 RepID=A0A1I8BC35_MELHA
MNKVYLIALLMMTFLGLSLCKLQTSQNSNTNTIDLATQNCSGNFDFDCGIGELNKRCISIFWTCDHIFDCTTGADEGLNCKYLHQCPPGYFMCRNGDCILANKRCDSSQDCLDRSDERACFDSNPKINVVDQHAEAFVEYDDQNDGPSFSILLFCLLLLVCFVILLIYCVVRRYPDTKFRVDNALKVFNHTMTSIPSRISGRSTEARVNILVPTDDSHYFDNPLSTLQPPLTLNVSEMANV